MKKQPQATTNLDNTIVDHANDLTYKIIANHSLTDGELFSAIRVALLKGAPRPSKGQTLVINSESHAAEILAGE